MATPKVCVIGAGSSGMVMAKTLHQRGFEFDCFEKSDRVGGNWVFKNKNGRSAAYRSLHINTSRNRMAYSDFPMPAHYPDFPHHSLIADYFEAYVDHFGFREKIRFETGVKHAELDANGRWRVSLDTGEQKIYDALAVANGHHWDPRWPTPPFPGQFDGIQMHAHDYIDPEEPHVLKNKRVLVLGMGNSAMDIACELSRPGEADRVFLAARRSAWVVPHYMFGRPMDQLLALPPWLPFEIQRAVIRWAYRLAVGRVENYGLKAPDHDIGHAHPTISSDFLPRLGRGDITPKPNIKRLRGHQVEFSDGSVESIDVIIYCTGYNVSFPFFEPSFISAPDNELPLYFRVFKPGLNNLFFIGLLQPLGAVMPLAEAQSEWVCDFMSGRYALPRVEDMWQHIRRQDQQMRARYIASARHTMQVDFDRYLFQLKRERRVGAGRAQKKHKAQQSITAPVASA